MVHVKDMGAKQAMVDIGAGTIDFRTIFARGAGIEHYFVEHDDPKDSLAFAKRAANYLKNLSY